MRIRRLKIENFRGIGTFEIDDLSDVVVIAGPNGCGKSSLLDAIRFLKSMYAAEEIEQWFGEFNIRTNDGSDETVRLLRSRERPLNIEIDIELALTESAFLVDNADRILTRLITRRPYEQMQVGYPSDQSNLTNLTLDLDTRIAQAKAGLTVALDGGHIALSVQMDSAGKFQIAHNLAASMLFQSYEPSDLGVIDYYSAQRQYVRERIGGVNLDVNSLRDLRRQHLLYNGQGKLHNIKTELASSYVTDLIAADAGEPHAEGSLQRSMAELFGLFFPGKTFDGVVPTVSGGLSFPVRLEDGSLHDIDDLSSGEKEIVYGYLRLRNSRPTNSVLLLDEPELHLNPRLASSLPQFYRHHISEPFNCQVWLVTHSDAVLRESIGSSDFSVFHMQAATSSTPSVNQAHALQSLNEADQAVLDLVGDLAAYRAEAPILIVEGEHQNGIDFAIISRLFPEVAERVNIVSAGSRGRVKEVYSSLSQLGDTTSSLARSVHAVVDSDNDAAEGVDGVVTWNVYHIENYLLDDSAIEGALVAANGHNPYGNKEAVSAALLNAARSAIDEVVEHELRSLLNRKLVGSIDLGFQPSPTDLASAFFDATKRSRQRFEAEASALSLAEIQRFEADSRSRHKASLLDGSWRSNLRGRTILKRFAANLVGEKVRYEQLRYLILDQMVISGRRPDGMENILRALLPPAVFESPVGDVPFVDRSDTISVGASARI